ncbi:uncharacterized protein V1516DRAFT_677258 [Lipomyces oligophaga]|uniref:uncharacterized protein n=1 Tax=Lipomyces oligophaga TaxID=45792 RepID=UPI0034CE2D90
MSSDFGRKIILEHITRFTNASADQAQDTYETRVKNKPLPLHPTREDGGVVSKSSNKRRLQRIFDPRTKRLLRHNNGVHGIRNTSSVGIAGIEQLRITKLDKREQRRLERNNKKISKTLAKKRNMRKRQRQNNKLAKKQNSDHNNELECEETTMKNPEADEESKQLHTVHHRQNSQTRTKILKGERSRLISLATSQILNQKDKADPDTNRQVIISTVTRPKPFSSATKKRLRLHTINSDPTTYDVYTPLHDLWKSYINELIGSSAGTPISIHQLQEAASKLASADYHGAKILVQRSRCVSRVGLSGIVIRETKSSFVIVTEQNQIKTIPKEATIFQVGTTLEPGSSDGKSYQNQEFSFLLHGSQLQYRPADRGARKFKSKPVLDL